jgi:pyruvate-formate lyase
VQAVDRDTLLQLRGAAARGFAFDKYYGMDDTSDKIFTDVVENLVDSIFKARRLRECMQRAAVLAPGRLRIAGNVLAEA